VACIGLAVAEVTVDVTVRAIAAGGSGVADLPDGRVVFVPRTAPGDRARVHIQRSKPRWATGSLRALIEPSPSRREAPCGLYDVCGGCQLQHLPYELQLEWKARFVKDALERIGGVALADRPPIAGSPHETRYRSRIAFSLRRLGKGRVIAGFHALDRPGRIVDVHDECLLPRAPLLDAWVALRAAWGEGARLLPRGESLRLTLRQDPGGIVLVVEGGEARWSATPLLEASNLAAIWHRPDGRSAARLEAGSAEAGSPAFTQVNPEVADSMVEHVLGLVDRADEPVGRPAERTAIDAYSGAGHYARRLAARRWTVSAIELDPVACEAARKASRDSYVVLEGRVEDRLPEVLPADLLIVNPPRAGLGPEVVGAITTAPPERLVYVSCDPATLGRDVAALAERYEIRSIACFDLFPQTAHVETVVELHRREGAR
jgi:23S rRNA (uracil1939-C5)-methyltransferase